MISYDIILRLLKAPNHSGLTEFLNHLAGHDHGMTQELMKRVTQFPVFRCHPG